MPEVSVLNWSYSVSVLVLTPEAILAPQAPTTSNQSAALISASTRLFDLFHSSIPFPSTFSHSFCLSFPFFLLPFSLIFPTDLTSVVGGPHLDIPDSVQPATDTVTDFCVWTRFDLVLFRVFSLLLLPISPFQHLPLFLSDITRLCLLESGHFASGSDSILHIAAAVVTATYSFLRLR